MKTNRSPKAPDTKASAQRAGAHVVTLNKSMAEDFLHRLGVETDTPALLPPVPDGDVLAGVPITLTSNRESLERGTWLQDLRGGSCPPRTGCRT